MSTKSKDSNQSIHLCSLAEAFLRVHIWYFTYRKCCNQTAHMQRLALVSAFAFRMCSEFTFLYAATDIRTKLTFLAYQIRISACFTWTDKSFLAHRIRISACFTWTNKSFSCTPDKDIRVFYLNRQFFSHPCYLTQDRIKIT